MNPYEETILTFNSLVFTQPKLFDPQTRSAVFSFVRLSLTGQSEWYLSHPSDRNAPITERVSNGLCEWMFSDESHPLTQAFMSEPLMNDSSVRGLQGNLNQDISEQEMLKLWDALERESEKLYNESTLNQP